MHPYDFLYAMEQIGYKLKFSTLLKIKRDSIRVIFTQPLKGHDGGEVGRGEYEMGGKVSQ